LGKQKKIEQIHNQLKEKRKKIIRAKKYLVQLISIVLIFNLFTLFYYFNKFILIIEISITLIIVSFLLMYIYINSIKNNCIELEQIIYRKQKL